MTQEVYRDLLETMKRRGGPYAGLDIPEFFTLVETLFSPEEAEVNNALTRKPASARDVAAALNRPEDKIQEILEKMVDKGLTGTYQAPEERLYQGLPFMPGIFEFVFISGAETEYHKKVAERIQAYKKAFQADRGVRPVTFPVTRVIPVDRTIRADNLIHTYDQVMTYIEKYDAIGVGVCYCRQAAKLRGEDIHGMPLEVCMWFGPLGEHLIERLGGKRVTKVEARELLDRCEEAGLLHMSRNTTEDIDFLCNCDRWHCEVVTQMLKQPKPGLIFNSGFQPDFGTERCLACGTCIERCPSQALFLGENNVPAVDLDRCFGCGTCATGCPEGAIAMESKPGFPAPPKTVKELGAAIKGGA